MCLQIGQRCSSHDFLGSQGLPGGMVRVSHKERIARWLGLDCRAETCREYDVYLRGCIGCGTS